MEVWRGRFELKVLKTVVLSEFSEADNPNPHTSASPLRNTTVQAEDFKSLFQA
jgi:hypothetical protein